MHDFAKNQEFEKAAAARDALYRLREGALGLPPTIRSLPLDQSAFCLHGQHLSLADGGGCFRAQLRKHRPGRIEVDSAGTHGYHVGEAPDPRTQRAAAARGYDLSGFRARKVAPGDLEYFDLVLAMDKAISKH